MFSLQIIHNKLAVTVNVGLVLREGETDRKTGNNPTLNYFDSLHYTYSSFINKPLLSKPNLMPIKSEPVYFTLCLPLGKHILEIKILLESSA